MELVQLDADKKVIPSEIALLMQKAQKFASLQEIMQSQGQVQPMAPGMLPMH